MIHTYIIKVILTLFITFQWQRVDTEIQQMNETRYLCGCFNRTCVLKNITCIDDGENRWMGLRNFSFRLLQNGTGCDSLDISTLIPKQQDVQCKVGFNIEKKILQKFSGITIAGQDNQKQYSIDYCPEPNPSYFVVNYDCITYNSASELVLDSLCSINRNLTELSLSSSKSYPSFGMNSSGVRSCSCSLTVTSSKLLLRTYDNRLSENQTLTLSYSNHTILESWQIPKDMTEVLRRKYIDGPFSLPLLLNWTNNANKDGGKLWIVIEAINGSIHVLCQQNATAIPTSVQTSIFATHPVTTTSAIIATHKLESIQTRSSTTVTKSAFASTPALAPTATIISPSLASIQSNESPATLTPSTFASIQTKASSAKVKSITFSSKQGGITTSTSYHMKTSGLVYSSETPTMIASYVQSSTQSLNTKESREPTDGHANIGVIIGGVLGGLFALILLILCCLFFFKKKKHRTEPEKGTQPAKNTFKGSRITQGKQNGAIKGSKARNEVDAEKRSSFSITNNSLPPVPIGGSLINSQTNNGNHNKRDGYQGSPGERRENLTNDDAIGRLKKNLLGKLSGTGQRMVNDDVAPLTKNTVDREIIIKEQQINTSDTSTNIQEKKKKKKKKRKKKNTIEALLGEDDTSIA